MWPGRSGNAFLYEEVSLSMWCSEGRMVLFNGTFRKMLPTAGLMDCILSGCCEPTQGFHLTLKHQFSWHYVVWRFQNKIHHSWKLRHSQFCVWIFRNLKKLKIGTVSKRKADQQLVAGLASACPLRCGADAAEICQPDPLPQCEGEKGNDPVSEALLPTSPSLTPKFICFSSRQALTFSPHEALNLCLYLVSSNHTIFLEIANLRILSAGPFLLWQCASWRF